MNILLADIQSLGLDLRELPAVDESVAREFAGMLRNSLDGASGVDLQVFDFNELYRQIDEVDPARLQTPTGGEDSAWRS